MRQGIKLKPFDLIKENKYRIVRHIADGGEGYIYLAQDAFNNNRICIVKQMFQEPWSLKGIENDYQIFSGLFHPNIVQVLDFFWDNDIFYIVMNYIAGQTLKSYLNKLPEPPNELRVLDWGNKLAHIIDFLHSRPTPIFHADIAPDNIVINDAEDLILIDFGIARNNYEAVGMRELYSAPEQVEHGILNPSTDVYSLGATLYKCLTLQDQPEAAFDPREVNENINPAISEMIRKCTAPKSTSLFGLVKNRYQDMLEVIDSISDCYIGSAQSL